MDTSWETQIKEIDVDAGTVTFASGVTATFNPELFQGPHLFYPDDAAPVLRKEMAAFLDYLAAFWLGQKDVVIKDGVVQGQTH